MNEARVGLENLEKEMPIFPAFTHAGGNFTKHSNKLLMNNNALPEQSTDIRKNTIQKSLSFDQMNENLDAEEENFKGTSVVDTLLDEKISPNPLMKVHGTLLLLRGIKKSRGYLKIMKI